jgi:hypothetical protein
MPQPIVKINAATNCQNQCLNVLNHYRNSILKLLPQTDVQNHCCNGILKELLQAAFKITATNNHYKQHSKSLP